MKGESLRQNLDKLSKKVDHQTGQQIRYAAFGVPVDRDTVLGSVIGKAQDAKEFVGKVKYQLRKPFLKIRD
jgi:hypothetical protein